MTLEHRASVTHIVLFVCNISVLTLAFYDKPALIVSACMYTTVSLPPDSMWQNLDTRSSNTVRACVELLLECAEYTADIKPPTISKKSSPRGGTHDCAYISVYDNSLTPGISLSFMKMSSHFHFAKTSFTFYVGIEIMA